MMEFIFGISVICALAFLGWTAGSMLEAFSAISKELPLIRAELTEMNRQRQAEWNDQYIAGRTEKPTPSRRIRT